MRSVEGVGVGLPAVCRWRWGYCSPDVADPNGGAPSLFQSGGVFEEERVDVGPVGDDGGDWWGGVFAGRLGDVVRLA